MAVLSNLSRSPMERWVAPIRSVRNLWSIGDLRAGIYSYNKPRGKLAMGGYAEHYILEWRARHCSPRARRWLRIIAELLKRIYLHSYIPRICALGNSFDSTICGISLLSSRTLLVWHWRSCEFRSTAKKERRAHSLEDWVVEIVE